MADVKLTLEQDYVLMTLIKEEYTSSNMNDTKFAEYANSKLKLNINRRHIANRRYALKIISNAPPPGMRGFTDKDSLELRVEALEKQLMVIQHMLDKL